MEKTAYVKGIFDTLAQAGLMKVSEEGEFNPGAEEILDGAEDLNINPQDMSPEELEKVKSIIEAALASEQDAEGGEAPVEPEKIGVDGTAGDNVNANANTTPEVNQQTNQNKKVTGPGAVADTNEGLVGEEKKIVEAMLRSLR
jgi:hypothetical protein